MWSSARYFILGFLVFISVLFFPGSRVEAASLVSNSLTFFSRKADVLVIRISDLVHYLIMQKRYTFDNYSDPNVYTAWKLPQSFDETIGALDEISQTIGPVKVSTVKVGHSLPVSVSSSTIPTIEPTAAIPAKVTAQVATSVPSLVISNQSVISPPVITTVTSGILKYTNLERTKAGLQPLTSNFLLDKIAAGRVADLFVNQYFEHDSPVGKSAPDLAQVFGYDYLLIGENLARGIFAGDQGIVSAWMDSPGHRANILNSKYQELGVAQREALFEGELVTIAVQIFGNPGSTCAKPNAATKDLIVTSTASIIEMQARAKKMYEELEVLKTKPDLNRSYYDQKVQEYNYFAKDVNEAVINLKKVVDLYNSQVSQYNSCL